MKTFLLQWNQRVRNVLHPTLQRFGLDLDQTMGDILKEHPVYKEEEGLFRKLLV